MPGCPILFPQAEEPTGVACDETLGPSHGSWSCCNWKLLVAFYLGLVRVLPALPGLSGSTPVVIPARRITADHSFSATTVTRGVISLRDTM
jgi:hypothetical protein